MTKAEQLAKETRARLVMPSVHIYDRGVCIFDTSRNADSTQAPDEYIPSWMHVIRTAAVPYLHGHHGRVTPVSSAHPSSRRVYA